MFQSYFISDTEQFVPSDFPQLTVSLQQVVVQLASWSQAPKAEMILSFVKDHSIRSQQVKDYPELAELISTKSLPLHVMEALFTSGRQNLLFKKQLEDYIRSYFIDQKL